MNGLRKVGNRYRSINGHLRYKVLILSQLLMQYVKLQEKFAKIKLL